MAIAAKQLQHKLSVSKILIVDWVRFTRFTSSLLRVTRALTPPPAVPPSGRPPRQRHPGSLLQRPQRALHLLASLRRRQLLPGQRVSGRGERLLPPLPLQCRPGTFCRCCFFLGGVTDLRDSAGVGGIRSRRGLQCERGVDRRPGPAHGGRGVPGRLQVKTSQELQSCGESLITVCGVDVSVVWLFLVFGRVQIFLFSTSSSLCCSHGHTTIFKSAKSHSV